MFLQRCQGFRGAAQAELRTLQMASCCVTQITGPQLIHLVEAALVMVIREIQTTQLRSPLRPLASGLGAVSQLPLEFGLGELEIDLRNARFHQLKPTFKQEFER